MLKQIYRQIQARQTFGEIREETIAHSLYSIWLERERSHVFQRLGEQILFLQLFDVVIFDVELGDVREECVFECVWSYWLDF